MGFQSKAELLEALKSGKTITNDKGTRVFYQRGLLMKSVNGGTPQTCSYTFPENMAYKWWISPELPKSMTFDAKWIADDILGHIMPDGVLPEGAEWRQLVGKKTRLTIELLN